MRRMLFPILIAVPIVAGIALLVVGIIEMDFAPVDLAMDMFHTAGFVTVIWMLQRLLTDWPAGVMFAAGREAEYRRRKRHAKRRSFDIVRSPKDDRL